VAGVKDEPCRGPEKVLKAQGYLGFQVGFTTISLLDSERRVRLVLDAFERLLWWLFAGSAGAMTRAQILSAVRKEPRNAQQLSLALNLDYTTIRHHLKVLEQNRIVVTEGTAYGRLYFVSDAMEAHWSNLQVILDKARGRGKK